MASAIKSSVRQISCREGDLIIAKYHGAITGVHAERIAKKMRAMLPKGTRFLIVDNEFEFIHLRAPKKTQRK